MQHQPVHRNSLSEISVTLRLGLDIRHQLSNILILRIYYIDLTLTYYRRKTWTLWMLVYLRRRINPPQFKVKRRTQRLHPSLIPRRQRQNSLLQSLKVEIV